MNKVNIKSEKEIKRSAKMEFIARITLEDGSIEERTVEVDGGVPGMGDMDFSSIAGVQRSFSVYEQATISASNKLREEIADSYMKRLSKKEQGVAERLCEIECETGRINVYLYGDVCSSLGPKERIWDVSLADKILSLASDTSYAKATNYTNGFLHREKGRSLCLKTVEDFAARVGEAIGSAYSQKADAILTECGIDSVTGIPKECSEIQESVLKPVGIAKSDKQLVYEVANRYNEARERQLQIPSDMMSLLPEGNPKECIYVYADDVLVKHQKDSHKPDSKRDSKFVYNSVISIQHGDKQYSIASKGMREAFKRLMAFLLSGHLLENRQLIFISDGATEIRDCIEQYFWFRQHTLYLDWFHLQQKCYQYLSSALKCGKKMKEDKERIEKRLYGILWTGNTKGALDYIDSIESKYIKSQDAIDSLKGYIERKKEYIPCYAIRKGLGLHNSSNPVEKDNDLLVAKRQKGKGMAWSVDGSAALAAITVAGRNKERIDILYGREPGFAFAA